MLCMPDIASVSSQHASSRLNRGCRRAVVCVSVDWLGWRPTSACCGGTAMGGNVIWMTGCRAGLQHSLLTYRPWGWAAVSMISCAQGGLDVCMRGWVIFLLLRMMVVVLRMAVRSETGSQLPSPLQRKSPGPGARQTRAKFGRSLPRLRSGRCRSVGSQRKLQSVVVSDKAGGNNPSTLPTLSAISTQQGACGVSVRGVGSRNCRCLFSVAFTCTLCPVSYTHLTLPTIYSV